MSFCANCHAYSRKYMYISSLYLFPMVAKLQNPFRLLRNLSVEQMKLLPKMTDNTKLRAMEFLSMLCMQSVMTMSNPMLLPLLSCRMIRLTMEWGFCDDSIVGLVMTAYSLVSPCLLSAWKSCLVASELTLPDYPSAIPTSFFLPTTHIKRTLSEKLANT